MKSKNATEKSTEITGENSEENAPPQRGWVLLCRPGYEQVLREEITRRLGSGATELVTGEGLVLLHGPMPLEARRLLKTPFIFERQRLPEARYFPLAPLQGLAEEIRALLPRLASTESGGTWAVHAFAANPGAPRFLAGWAGRLERALRGRDAPRSAQEGRDKPVLQLCAVPGGVWVGFSPARELSSPHPGGVHSMPADRQAPSRATLKLEEALQLLGVTPRARERVIDLGAAPGGWSYAFLKRGCRVLAVDNGPMKLDTAQLAGELTHLRANGMSFKPPSGWTPVDWLVSDMLIAPGQCLGLLRRWLARGQARRFIVNVKLPQRDPLVALRPIEEFLAGQRGLRFQLRQLYHDRREVTALGLVARQPRPTAARRGRGA